MKATYLPEEVTFIAFPVDREGNKRQGLRYYTISNGRLSVYWRGHYTISWFSMSQTRVLPRISLLKKAHKRCVRLYRIRKLEAELGKREELEYKRYEYALLRLEWLIQSMVDIFYKMKQEARVRIEYNASDDTEYVMEKGFYDRWFNLANPQKLEEWRER